MAFDLKKVLKALLFSSNEPLAIRDIQAAVARFHETPPPAAAEDDAAVPEGAPIEKIPEGFAEPPEAPELYLDVPSLITAAQIREAMDAIAAELRAADEGLLLVEGASGYRLATHPRFARWVRILRQEPPPAKLSPSSLETLAVVAYRQPVTRAEIETIRGVSAEAGINRLLERDLIVISGRAESPGRPLLYGTTDRFLEFIGIKSADELPASDVLTSRQIDEWLRNAAAPRNPGDVEMGLGEEPQLAAAGATPDPNAAGQTPESHNG
jgi:segregation and condensation protein B